MSHGGHGVEDNEGVVGAWQQQEGSINSLILVTFLAILGAPAILEGLQDAVSEEDDSHGGGHH